MEYSIYQFVSPCSFCFLCGEKEPFHSEFDKWHHVMVFHEKISDCQICPSRAKLQKKNNCLEHFQTAQHKKMAHSHAPKDEVLRFLFEEL
jgi:hypothetical protein